jgi:hypothetical protein
MGVVGLCSILGLLLIRFCTNSRILYGMAQVDQVFMTSYQIQFQTKKLLNLILHFGLIIINIPKYGILYIFNFNIIYYRCLQL